MEIRFHDLRFDVTEDRLRLTDCAHFHSERGRAIAEVQIAGENKPTHMGTKMIERLCVTLVNRTHQCLLC